MSFNQVSRNDGTEIAVIDKGVKNPFKWHWLERKDVHKMYYSEWVRKVDISGKAWCLLCKKLLNYSNQGITGFDTHAKGDKHKEVVLSLKNNTILPTTHHAEEPQPVCTMPYGAAPNIHRNATCNARTEVLLPKIPSFVDRRSIFAFLSM